MSVICNYKDICKVPIGKCYHAGEHEAEEGADDCRVSGTCDYDVHATIHITACIEV